MSLSPTTVVCNKNRTVKNLRLPAVGLLKHVPIVCAVGFALLECQTAPFGERRLFFVFSTLHSCPLSADNKPHTRLENASWRLQAMLRKGKQPGKKISIGGEEDGIPGLKLGKIGESLPIHGDFRDSPRLPMHAQAENLLSVALEHG